MTSPLGLYLIATLVPVQPVGANRVSSYYPTHKLDRLCDEYNKKAPHEYIPLRAGYRGSVVGVVSILFRTRSGHMAMIGYISGATRDGADCIRYVEQFTETTSLSLQTLTTYDGQVDCVVSRKLVDVSIVSGAASHDSEGRIHAHSRCERALADYFVRHVLDTQSPWIAYMNKEDIDTLRTKAKAPSALT